ncbi:MAG: HAMP domain-containing histidine kinase [Bacteroidia bacterium]|nr:HAMP domain-containing histidine kinase [Bacteroidia bacterium]
MGIRNKILLYFSLVSIVLSGAALFFIYSFFYDFRLNEFQQRQKEKILSTLNLLAEIQQIDNSILEAIDQLKINDIYDEKLLLFNSKKELIYSSIDDTPVIISRKILENLNSHNRFVVTTENNYDVVGAYIEKKGDVFYGISKAYDISGFSKLHYLRNITIIAFIGISIIILFVSFYLSGIITKPLIALTNKIKDFNIEQKYLPLESNDNTQELTILVSQFNLLMQKIREAYSFQKHAVHHISHELKTPISVLVSNLEKAEKEKDIEKIRLIVAEQKENSKSLGDIINALLEISKSETGKELIKSSIRIDELIFDISEELKYIYPDFIFSIEYKQANDENSLIIKGNESLIKSAFTNLMQNCIKYSDGNVAQITISCVNEELVLSFINQGETISTAEIPFLFQHFFRGGNSKNEKGFGLGLVFINKIIELHGGKILYQTDNIKTNIFEVKFPLS